METTTTKKLTGKTLEITNGKGTYIKGGIITSVEAGQPYKINYKQEDGLTGYTMMGIISTTKLASGKAVTINDVTYKVK